MKKLLILVMLLSIAVTLFACAEETADTQNDLQLDFIDPNAVVPNYGKLGFAANGKTFGIYDKVDDVLAAIGDPSGTFDAESCAYQGKDYFYYFSGFELTTNDFDGIQRITLISIIDDTVAIPQGVKIGMSLDEALALMPNDYTQSTGIYSFTDGSCLLRLRSEEGVITGIEYSVAD